MPPVHKAAGKKMPTVPPALAAKKTLVQAALFAPRSDLRADPARTVGTLSSAQFNDRKDKAIEQLNKLAAAARPPPEVSAARS